MESFNDAEELVELLPVGGSEAGVAERVKSEEFTDGLFGACPDGVGDETVIAEREVLLDEFYRVIAVALADTVDILRVVVVRVEMVSDVFRRVVLVVAAHRCQSDRSVVVSRALVAEALGVRAFLLRGRMLWCLGAP